MLLRPQAGLFGVAVLLALLDACGPPAYKLSEQEQCPNGWVVTVVNPTNLEVDVTSGGQFVGTVPANTTETLPLRGRPGAVSTKALPPKGLDDVHGTPAGNPLTSIRSRVHCAGT